MAHKTCTYVTQNNLRASRRTCPETRPRPWLPVSWLRRTPCALSWSSSRSRSAACRPNAAPANIYGGGQIRWETHKRHISAHVNTTGTEIMMLFCVFAKDYGVGLGEPEIQLWKWPNVSTQDLQPTKTLSHGCSQSPFHQFLHFRGVCVCVCVCTIEISLFIRAAQQVLLFLFLLKINCNHDQVFYQM